ncbi:MAG: DUF6883 domain-containing protein [Limisphaerales bacterium]
MAPETSSRRPNSQARLAPPAHPDNGGKAPFFFALGFRQDDWQSLATALRKLAATSRVTKKIESPHGVKYILDGEMETQGGRSPTMRTIWIAEPGVEGPRLVTAYPSRDRGNDDERA